MNSVNGRADEGLEPITRRSKIGARTKAASPVRRSATRTIASIQSFVVIRVMIGTSLAATTTMAPITAPKIAPANASVNGWDGTTVMVTPVEFRT